MGKDLKGKELGTGISQLKDGRYKARYTNRYGRRMPPIYSRNLKEVKERLSKAKYEDDLGNNYIPHKGITVDEVFNLWIKEKENDVRATTIYSHKRQYEYDISPYKYYRISNITINVVEEFMTNLIERNLTLGTIIDIKATFSGIMDYAVSHGMCLSNPFKNYKIPKSLKYEAQKRKEQRKASKFLTEKQRKLFLEYINNSKRCYLRSLYTFLMHTGLRIGEGIALKWEHVDLDKKMIFVQDGYSRYYEDGMLHMVYDGLTKTVSSTRKIPINDMAYNILCEEKTKVGTNPSGLIFLNTRGEPITYNSVSKCLKSMISTMNKRIPDAHFPDITPHWFRHTFATMCLEKEVSPKAVQYLLGHANIAMTMDLYSHMTEDLAIKEIQKMN